jgi:hypothetical protein
MTSIGCMSEIEEKAKTLVRHLLGLGERKLRASYLEAKLQHLPAEDVVDILNMICIRANAKILPYLKAYIVFPELLRSLNLNREKVSQFRAIARQKDYTEVLQRFLDLSPRENLPANFEAPQESSLKKLTVGERKSLAKTLRLEVLKKLLHEQDSSVIRTLLVNPRMTEIDVLKVASLQPTSPKVLEEIFKNAKWIARYRVKKALASNPYCPPSLALYLLKFMVTKDLREIAQNENLHFAVQEAAHQLLTDEG